MPVGTKVFLAVFALVVGVLIVYYGVLMPGAGDPHVTAPELAGDARANPDIPAHMPRGDTLGTSASTTPAPAASQDHTRPVGSTGEPAASDRVSLGGLGDGANSTNPPLAIPESRPTFDPPPVTVTNPNAPAEAATELPGDSPNRPEPVEEESPDVTLPGSPPAIEMGGGAERATPPVQVPPPPEDTFYTVKQHDTLSDIALMWFGNAQKWDLILAANPSIDPRRLQVGQKLRLPPRESQRTQTVTARTQGVRTYVVRAGDTLSSIAESTLGDAALWRRVYAANQRTIGGNPDRLAVGMQLIIPDRQ